VPLEFNVKLASHIPTACVTSHELTSRDDSVFPP